MRASRALLIGITAFLAGSILSAAVAVLAVRNRPAELPTPPPAPPAGAAATDPGPNPRPGQPGHRPHQEWQGAYPSIGSQGDFKLLGTLTPPKGFLGHIAYDPPSRRLWLVSFGPPTGNGPSTLYELDPQDGRILARAELPFKGDLSAPICIDGELIQGVYHESKMHVIDVKDRTSPRYGSVVRSVTVPSLTDLKLVNEAHPFPFIEYGGVTPYEGNIMIHADDAGELITLEKATGSILHRVRTLKALGGIMAVPGPGGKPYVIGNSDPRGGYCALSFPPELSRSPEQRDISWAMMEARSGELVASVRIQDCPAYASSIALIDHESVKGTPYGNYKFFALGEAGILKLSWTPGRDQF